MKRPLLWISVAGIALPIVAGLAMTVFFKRTSDDFQHDADTVRLADLEQLYRLVEEFKEKTGGYPLQGESELPHYVEIATREQQKHIQDGPPYPIAKTAVSKFMAKLADGCRRDIELPFDPQRRPRRKPAFYLYMIHHDRFVLAIHVHEEFPFARHIAPGYSKIQVSNLPYAPEKIHVAAEFFASTEFQQAKTREMKKPDYFGELREKIRAEQPF